MNTKALYAIIAIVALLIVGLLVYNQSRDGNEVASDSNNASSASNVNQVSNTNVPAANVNAVANNNTNGQFTDESDMDSGAVHEVVFNGTAFTPANLSIKMGDTVVFRNSSKDDFWPASGPHPQHTLYPEFDAKKAMAPGSIYSFKFLKVGEWPYHDHLRPAAFGKITVTQ